MILDAGILRGWPRERAELYGKPHPGARYTHGKPTRRFRHDAASAAGVPEACTTWRTGLGARRSAWSRRAALDLRSPLFCLCGSGTTGCHDKFHGGARLKAEWAWRHPVYEEATVDGPAVAGLRAAQPRLYEYGYWLITDRDGNEMIREGM